MNIPPDLDVSIIYVEETLRGDGSIKVTLDWIGDSPYVWVATDYLIQYGDTEHPVPGTLITLIDYTFQIIGCDTLRDLWLLERIAPPMS